MNTRYTVIVSNIGCVRSTGNLLDAVQVWNEYRSQSQEGYGRAAHETVTLLDRGEPIKEFSCTCANCTKRTQADSM